MIHSVLAATPKLPDAMALAKALAAVRKTAVQDQVITAKRAWGIIAENLSEQEARFLVESLKTAGLETICRPSSELAPVPAMEPVASLAKLPSFPPILIAAAAITITTSHTKTTKEGPSGAQKILNTAIFLGTGIPTRIGGKERIVEKKQQQSELYFYADLIYQEPLQRLRIDAEHFDYSFLKERKLYQLAGNFKLLLGDLVKAHPTAQMNHGARILMEGKPMHTMGYESIADLERETKWLLHLQVL